MTKCPICGGSEWDKGNIECGELFERNIRYNTQSKKIPAHMVLLRGMVCINCGYVLIYIDPKYLKKNDSGEEGQ